MRPEAVAALAEWKIRLESLSELAGDASTRRYLRGRDVSQASVIVMDCGGPLPGMSGGRDGFAFTRWQAFYRDLGIRVPGVMGVAREAGLVLLEDLGDELLQLRVESAGAAACEPAYQRAVSWGRLLAEEGAHRFDPPGDPDEDPLVPARLALEMDLFLVHASGLMPPEGDASLPPLQGASRALEEAAAAKYAPARALLHRLCEDVHGFAGMVPCHRDYHARNLMMTGSASSEDVAVIDFQDTRRGPRAYDLVSLAWDPYVTLPGGMIDRLVEAWRPQGSTRSEWDEELRLAAGQRLLKAAGSYAWLSRKGGKPQFARWLEPALERAHERLEHWPLRDELWRELARCGVVEG